MNYDQLSFLTQEDQSKFLQLFQQATNSNSISPDVARNILMKSNLGPHQLAKIWELSDTNKSGSLLFPEFALALHLCNIALRGVDLPFQLDQNINDEVTRAVDKINFSVPEDQQEVQQLQQPPSLLRSATQDILENKTLQQQESLLLQNQPTGYGFQHQPTQFNGTFNTFGAPPLPPLNYQQTGFQQPPADFAPQAESYFSSQAPISNASQTQKPLIPQTPGHAYTPNVPPVSSFSSTSSINNFKAAIPSLPQQQTGFVSSQPSQSIDYFSVPPANQQSATALTTQQTGLVPLNNQQTGFVPLNNQQTGLVPLNNQQTGLVPLKNQQTGLVPLNNQQTGLVPLSNQQTGPVKPQLTQQPTGLVPLNSQRTGPVPTDDKSTGPASAALSQQPTGLVPLTQQPTGLVPLNNQQTGSVATLNQQPTGLVPLSNQQTGNTLQRQATGLIPLPKQTTGYQPLPSGSTGGAGILLNSQNENSKLPPLQNQKTGYGNFEPLRQQKTGIGQNSFFLSNLIQQQEQSSQQYFDTVSMYTNEQISPQEKQLFSKIFENYDINKKGLINADVSAEIFRKSGLNREELEKVWDLITRPNQSKLDKESFQLGMWLVYKRLNGYPIPEYLPDSLKPSSLKILDDVKSKLKANPYVSNVKRSSNSKINASRFKNNDDELVMSVSRHRRRRATDSNEQTKEKENIKLSIEKLSTEELKKAIWEKKILLEAIKDDSENVEIDLQSKEIEDLKAIEKLKEDIKNLPSVSNSSNSNSELKSKFNELLIKVPNLINEISFTISTIKNLKLDLYKIENPSVILGSGPNGEVTDSDRKKFKSKQLLAIKMAKLTGKPLDPEVENYNHQEEKLHEEVEKIQKDNETNQKVIKDIEDSISELSKSITTALNKGNNYEDENYKKYELGIGVQPEIQELIKTFRIENLSNRFTNNLSFNEPAPRIISAPSSIASSSIPSTPVEAPNPRTVTNFKSQEERKAYIREQARKKMSEKLAKFGIRSASSSGVSSPVSASTPTFEPEPITAPVSAPEPVTQEPESDSSDDDEEEFQRMEEIRRLKKLERDERLRELEKLE